MNEFEIKYYLDPRISKETIIRVSADERAKRLHEFYDTIGDIEYTISLPSASSSIRRIINFPNGESKGKTEIFQDKRSIYPDIKRKTAMGGYKVSHMREEEVSSDRFKPAPPHEQFARIKIRQSYKFDKNWRLDITLVKECKVKELKAYRDKLIYPISNWINHAPWRLIDKIEFEVEWIGSDDDIPIMGRPSTERQIYDMYLLLAVEYDNIYLVYQSRISEMINHRWIDRFNKYGIEAPDIGFHNLLPKAKEIPPSKYDLAKYLDERKLNFRAKLNGVRCLILIANNTVSEVGNITYIDITSWDGSDDEYLFDCEKVNGVYYVLHVLYWRSENMSIYNESERLDLIDIREDGTPFEEFKNIELCPRLFGMSREEARKKLPKWKQKLEKEFEIEGFIVTTDDDYWHQECVKWKIKDEATIDFLVVKCPEQLIGKEPYVREHVDDTLWLLFISMTEATLKKSGHAFMKGYGRIFKHVDRILMSKMKPIEFSPPGYKNLYIWSSPDAPDNINERIVELAWDEKNTTWKFKKIREDRKSCFQNPDGRYMGNGYRTAIDTWERINNEADFTMNLLWTDPDDIKIEENKNQTDHDLAITELISNWDCPVEPTITKQLTRDGKERVSRSIVKVAVNGFCGDLDSFGDEYRRTFLINMLLIGGEATSGVTMSDVVISSDVKKRKLPLDFINGVNMLFDFEGTRYEMVKYGGYLVTIGDDLKVPVGFKVVTQMDDINVTIYRKLKRGCVTQSSREVREDNMHLNLNCDCIIEQQYETKFIKTKTPDSCNINVVNEYDTCPVNLKQDHRMGMIVSILEGLCGEYTRVKCNTYKVVWNDNVGRDILTKILDDVGMTNFDSIDNEGLSVDLLVCLDYKHYDVMYQTNPDMYILRCNEHTWKEWGDDVLNAQIPSGKKLLIPFSDWNSTDIIISGERAADFRLVDFSSITHVTEMRGFHGHYRLQAFKNSNIKTIDDTKKYDDCFDCKYLLITIKKFITEWKLNTLPIFE